MELFQGVDGHARVARIKTATGTSIRPVVKLYPLEQDLEGRDLNIQPSEDDNSSTDLPSQASSGSRTQRRTALGCRALWRSKIAAGDL